MSPDPPSSRFRVLVSGPFITIATITLFSTFLYLSSATSHLPDFSFPSALAPPAPPPSPWTLDAIDDPQSFWSSRWSQGRWAPGLPKHFSWELPTLDNDGDDDASYAPIPPLDPTAARACLAERWIVLVGDSSTRIFFSALVDLLEYAFPGDAMPQFERWVCGGAEGELDVYGRGCGKKLKGLTPAEIASKVEDDGCVSFPLPHLPLLLPLMELLWGDRYYRDVTIGNHTRLTFIFKTYASSTPLVLPQLLIPGTHPSLLILQSGAWDGYKRNPIPSSLLALSSFVSSLRSYYLGPMVWMNLLPCHADFVTYGKEFNEGAREVMRGLGVPVFDRAVTLGGDYKRLGKKCEGWHAWEEVVQVHVQGFLQGICRSP